MFVRRAIVNDIKTEILKEEQSRIIVLYGARQVGKTTLVENILDNIRKNGDSNNNTNNSPTRLPISNKNLDKKILRINGDRLSEYKEISSTNLNRLQALVDGYDILFIDEAQRIPEIGINLKIIYDNTKSNL